MTCTCHQAWWHSHDTCHMCVKKADPNTLLDRLS